MRSSNVNVDNSNMNYYQLSKDYCIKGTLKADNGNLKGALENFNKAIEADPTNYVAYYNRATIRIDLGNIKEARKDFSTFVMLRK
ncbi:MAG: tetratricopeptide repeat protein [Ignavibacteriaceae bacterium]|jgi:Tfp pilus assembly protein PilF